MMHLPGGEDSRSNDRRINPVTSSNLSSWNKRVVPFRNQGKRFRLLENDDAKRGSTSEL
jgi:hypothetical protein